MMVAIMAPYSREKLEGLATSAKSATELPSKLHRLRNLRRNLQGDASVFPKELLPLLFDLLSDDFGAVRKFVAEILGEIGLKYVELIPEIVPLLIKSLKDETPAVARQVIACGTDLFRSTLERVAVQGLHSSEVNEIVESSWTWMVKLKDEICSMAFKQGNSGVKLSAMKFVEALILLYTPDPSGSLEPPSDEGSRADFNISIVRGGHPVLNIGDLSIEASQKLGLLLDQLRHPAAKSLNSSTVIVLINSLSSVAKKRPAYCGRILPVLLSLDPLSFLKGVHATAANLALKTVFSSCYKCTHPAAAPWKDRLIGALKEIEGGGRAGKVEDLFYKTNRSIQDKDSVEETKVSVEGNPLCASSVVADSNSVRKRSGSEYNIDLNGDALSGKRARITPSVSEESTEGSNGNDVGSGPRVASTSTGPSSSGGVSDTGPVQQLVAMFGALVAQGEKAIGSLEILISSISADLLADVVMANMHNIPANGSSFADGTDELLMNICIVGSDAIKYPPSFVAGVLSLSTAFPPIAALINPQIPKTENEAEELRAAHVDQEMLPVEDAVFPTGLSASSEASFPANEDGNIVFPPNVHYIESEIPGLDSSAQHNVLSEALVTSVLASTNVEAAYKNEYASFSGELLLAVIPSASVDKSEEFSPKAAGTVSNSLVSSTATSVVSAPQFVLPKISAPVVSLSDEEKDSLQKLVFLRIVEAYKQISMSGGSQLRFSFLAQLGVEFPSELDPWKILQEHVLSDYLSYEGHELTVRVLYRLYGEAEAEQDLFSSTTAASAYESFLLTVAEALRDSFPPSDKSLSKLLGDSPFLPKSVLKLLESFCCPGSGDNVERDLQNGDRVTQGLSAVWSLILTRPGIRNDCLKIALQSAVHHLEEIRMKAIRLVANKLYSLSFITQQIEEFAKDKLFSVVQQIQKDLDLDNPPNNSQLVSGVGMDTSSEATSVTEAQRCLSLYFALCTKKHSLFVHVFSIYKDAPDPVKQAIHRQIPILVRTMGSSSELLKIIADPPSGSENLLMQVLQTLTEGPMPSSELIRTIRKLFDTRIKDVEVLFPILPFLPRDDVLRVFPYLVNLPMEKFQVSLTRVLQGSSQTGPVLSPSEVLIAIHSIDPARDGIPLKQITDACNTCFAQRQTFTQQVLASVLNQLVQQIPLPMLFMRTVLQAIGAFPALSDFILEILSRLVSKQIWKYPKLWVGFLKCAQTLQPQSYKVLLQLPSPQLGNALTKISALRAPLTAHASQPDIQSSLPRSTLVVLGLVPDTQGAQTSQVQVQVSEAQTSQGQQQASESQQTSQSQQVSVPLSLSEADPQDTSQVVASQTQSSPIGGGRSEMSQTQNSPVGAGRSEMSQAQSSPVDVGRSEMSQSQSSPVGAGRSETSQSQNSPVGVGGSEMSQSQTSQSQNSPIGAGQSEMNQSQSSPTGAGQTEMDQSQSSPIGAGQSEMSETNQALDSDPPAPTSRTQTSDSQVSSQSQPEGEKIDDTATSENETTEIEKPEVEEEE